jgi:hypothetical protein
MGQAENYQILAVLGAHGSIFSRAPYHGPFPFLKAIAIVDLRTVSNSMDEAGDGHWPIHGFAV